MGLPEVLVVDDDIASIQWVQHILADEFGVRFARSGADALQMVALAPPDLILLDVDMPGMSGLEVCRRLKAEPRHADIPVIFVTRFTDEANELAALDAGATDFLHKPLGSGQVLARLRAHWRARRQLLRLLHPADNSPLLLTAEGAPARLLIVDDDPIARQALHHALRDSGASFEFAGSGQQALQLARRQAPSLVLLDWMMPDLDGLAVARQLQADPQLATVPIIVVTRYADPALEAAALAAGATDFIAKPFSEAVLQSRVRNVLQLKRRADDALRLERAHWRQLGDERVAQLLAVAPDGVVSVDADGVVRLANRAAQQWLAVTDSDLVGSRLFDRWPALAEVRPAAGVAWLLQLPASAMPGGQVEVLCSTQGSGPGALSTYFIRDLADRHRAEAAERQQAHAEAVNQTKTMMISYIAHELGNPLNGILGLSQLALEDSAEPLTPNQQRRMTLISHCGQQLQTLMSDVLDLHRLESGHFDLRPQLLAMQPALTDAASSVVSQAELAGVSLRLPAPGTALRVRADPTRLRQCLVNLLSNAIKYNRRGASVTLRAQAAGERTLIEVEDQGLGLTPEQLSHLFEPFNRLGRSLEAAGNGIGLVLTKQLVEAMSGSVLVRSTPGTGSCFTLDLPSA